MAPPVKTYARKKVVSISTSESAINALFTNNIYARKAKMVNSKRPKKPPEICNLPPIDHNHKLLSDSNKSFHVKGKEDTFEMLKQDTCKRVLRSSASGTNCKILLAEDFAENKHEQSSAININAEQVDSSCTNDMQSETSATNWNQLKVSSAQCELDANVSEESLLSYSHMFENYNSSLQGSSKRKRKSDHVVEMSSILYPNIDILINKTEKYSGSSGKFVICSTPLSKNQKLKKLDVLKPICVPDSASNNLLEESVHQIYKWNYKSPEATAYDQVIRRNRRRSCQQVSNHKKENLERSSSFSSFVSMKFASNQSSQKSHPELAIVLTRIPDEDVLETLKKQRERYNDLQIGTKLSEDNLTVVDKEIKDNDQFILSHAAVDNLSYSYSKQKQNVNTRKRFNLNNISKIDFEEFFTSCSESIRLNSRDISSVGDNPKTNNPSNNEQTNCNKNVKDLGLSNEQIIASRDFTEENIIYNRSDCKRRRLPRQAKRSSINYCENIRPTKDISKPKMVVGSIDYLNKYFSNSSSSDSEITEDGDLEENIQSYFKEQVIQMPVIQSVMSLYKSSSDEVEDLPIYNVEEIINTDNEPEILLKDLSDDQLEEQAPLVEDYIKTTIDELEKQDYFAEDKPSNINTTLHDTFAKPMILEAGKSWRRSLAKFKRDSVLANVSKGTTCLCDPCAQTTFSENILCRKSKYIIRNTEVHKRRQSMTRQSFKDYTYSKTHNEISHIIKSEIKNLLHENIKLPFHGFSSEEIERHEMMCQECINVCNTLFKMSMKDPGQFNTTLDSGYEHRLRETVQLEKFIEDISLNVSQLNVSSPNNRPARNIVLQRCGQIAPLSFSKCYSTSLLSNCHKIGEGVYGEVFLYRNVQGGATVMKIIPIEGETVVNGEKQKQFEEIISEIIIASELSNLRNNSTNLTSAFNELQQIRCVKGKYPEALIELWEMYDENKGSENDNPEIFDDDQLYIVLELAYAGADLESFVFTNFCEVYHCFIQIALSLAVAEEELQFEHRDLHWGNVLMTKTLKNDKCSFKIDGNLITVPTQGVFATIIDFTLSRITYDKICLYNDLSQDPDLFNAEGDYQFEIYRQMQKNNGNNWEVFSPYSNVLWLHYLLVKMTTSVNFARKKIAVRDKVFLNTLVEWENCLLNYKSAKEFVLEAVLPKLNKKKNKNCKT